MSTSAEPEVTKPGGFSYHTVLSALRCWWKIVVPISVICGGVAAATILLLHKPMYTSEAWVMIRPDPEHLLTETRANSQKFIQNQIQIIRSRRLLEPLIGKPEIVTTPELQRAQTELTVALAKLVSVKPVGQSDMYAVTFTSESAQKAHLIVDSVVEAYLKHNEQEEGKLGERLVESLSKQATKRHDELKLLRDKVKTTAKLLTGVDPFRAGSGKNEQEENKSQNPFADLQSEIVRLQVEQDVLTATISAEEQRLTETSYEPSEREIDKHIGLQESYQGQQAIVEQLEKREAEFLKTGKNLATNPLFKQVQASLAKEKESLEKLKVDLHDEIRDFLVNQARVDAEGRLKKLKSERDVADVRLRVLNEKFKEGMLAAQQFTGDTIELEFLRAKLQQVQAIYDAINNRILSINTEKDAPSRVEVYQFASKPDRPDELYPWKKIGMGAGLAFLVPLALCVAWEHFFCRVSNRSQLENIQQLSVVGEVTALPTRSRQSAVGGRSVQRDVLLFEESVDSLRTYLSLSERNRELRVIAVASAVSGEGKTSLAAQLAVCIARATREPTLLIDGDLRSPDIHNIFEIDAGPGLAEVLQNDCALEEAIDTSFSDRLHILTAGRLRTNPHRLLGSGDFQAMLLRLKANYRHIIIDTPPILPASESLVFARAADTAILCMRRDFSRLDQSQSAFHRMNSAGVHVSGAVLNGIPTRQYAYHYGSYEFSLDA